MESPRPYTVRRPLSERDLISLMEFDEMATFLRNDTPPDHAPPPFTLQELQSMFDKGEVMGGLFDNEGSLVAYYSFDIREAELYVDSIAVHPDYRDKGIGTYLLELADQEALQRGLIRCTLSVDPFNGRGVNAYLKHGYIIVDYKRAYFGLDYPETDRFWMEKHLISHNIIREEIKEILVNDVEGVEKAIREGYVGVSLVRSLSKDNRNNIIVFKK